MVDFEGYFWYSNSMQTLNEIKMKGFSISLPELDPGSVEKILQH